jgi:ATP-dependent Lhr-like helicase
VDFRPVEAVIQIGGPKGVARFFQRAGRSGHSPFATSKIWFAPTHSLELLEGAALKEAIAHNHFESRRPLKLSYDVLTQYLLTLAAGDGFEPDQIFGEIRKTHAYRELKRKIFDKIILSIVQGGESLSAYQEFRKAEQEGNLYIIKEKSIALRHRLSIGTIVSDPVMKVELRSGKVLGTIEEYFISKLNPGDVFWFSGKNLELLSIKNLSAIVKPAGRKKGVVPQWLGGRMPLSSQLSEIIRRKISSGSYTEPELLKLKNLFDIQQQISVIPRLNQLLVEKLQTKEGFHLFVFPFEGRYVNEALAWLTVHRLSSLTPGTFSIAVNDFGFELLSDTEPPIGKAIDKGLFSLKELYEDLNKSMNFGEMAKRRFREIATIAGLIFQGYPGKSIKNKHLQASAGLFFSVFNQYEPDNLLIRQAYDEVLSLNLDKQRLEKAIKKLETSEIILQNTSQPSPFAFPLLAERMRETMSYEKWEDRIEKLSAKLEKEVRRKG